MLLPRGKIKFSFSYIADLQLKPFRTDDFITRLYYETTRFSAFSQQWVIRAKINSDHKNPIHTINRTLSYQLVAKTKLSSPVSLFSLSVRCNFVFDIQEVKFNSMTLPFHSLKTFSLTTIFQLSEVYFSPFHLQMTINLYLDETFISVLGFPFGTLLFKFLACF